MSEREVKVGEIYKHFKGTFHRVICVGKDSETLEEMVIYDHVDTGEVWVRKKSSFLSRVDRKKYPLVEQTYRFELVDEES